MNIEWTDKPIPGTRNWTGYSKGKVIELRKTFSNHPNYAQVLIVITDKDNVTFSMNGKAGMTLNELSELADVINEVRTLI